MTDLGRHHLVVRFAGQFVSEHIDVLENRLDDGVDMPLAVVCQLDSEDHEAELAGGELTVGGCNVVGQPLRLEVGQNAARAAVPQQAEHSYYNDLLHSSNGRASEETDQFYKMLLQIKTC